jgi:hypothetical protein
MTDHTTAQVSQTGGYRELQAFAGRVRQRVQQYLDGRSDADEQADHLRHVADRTRWLYYSELQRLNPGVSIRISEHEDSLIQACVLSHDIGKWIPREALRQLLPEDPARIQNTFEELGFTPFQGDLFMLGVRQRLELPLDGYTPEYDSAHHLVSAYLLVTDDSLGFHHQHLADQTRLIAMIVGHQFGSYFKESLLELSLRGDSRVTTGMLMEVSRPDRLSGDLLACAFHDADISDLLFVGSLERHPYREEVFHTGGLIKILMINLTNCIYQVPSAPRDLEGCLRSCQATVTNACKEFLTDTAMSHGPRWRHTANRFLNRLRQRVPYEQLNAVLTDERRSASDRLAAVRILARRHAREYLSQPTDRQSSG